MDKPYNPCTPCWYANCENCDNLRGHPCTCADNNHWDSPTTEQEAAR